MGAGIGIACWPQHADDDDALLVRAEMAMYAAKRRSNGPVTYDPAIDATSAQTLTLISELRQAVDRNELRLYLQPKLALDDRRVVGAEALVRWQHPQRGLVPPMQFIPFAEQTGFIRTLTMWVFEEAARHWQTLADEGLQLRLSVNLSTRDLLDLDLPQKFAARARAPRRAGRGVLPRDHRERDHGRPAARARHAGRAERAGLQAVDRRLRHRLLVARLPEAAAGGRAQDRPVLRAQHAERPRRRDDRALDDRPRPQPGHHGRRRRRRDAPRPGTCCASSSATRPRATTWAARCPSTEFSAWSTSWGMRCAGGDTDAIHLLH